jgi:F0F1-type ATP synthase assembly protein I
MKIELIYTRIIVTLIVAIAIWFWVTPDAFNISPLLGAICFALPPVLGYWLIKPIFTQSKKVTNEKK